MGSAAAPHLPQQPIAANELVIEGSFAMAHQQRDKQAGAKAVRQARRIVGEVRQHCGGPRRSRYHADAAGGHAENDDANGILILFPCALFLASRSKAAFVASPPIPRTHRKNAVRDGHPHGAAQC